jgi:hypothetical protein
MKPLQREGHAATARPPSRGRGPRQRSHVAVSRNSSGQGLADLLADLHRYDGWWADAMTHTGEHYRGYIRTKPVDEEHLLLEGEAPGDAVAVDIRDIDIVEVRYPPHRFVVPWEL